MYIHACGRSALLSLLVEGNMHNVFLSLFLLILATSFFFSPRHDLAHYLILIIVFANFSYIFFFP